MSAQLLTAIVGGLIAAAVTMTGWFVTDYLRRKDARKVQAASFIERQIIELYAPLFFLAESEISYRQMRERAINAAPEDKRWAIWWAYSEQFVVPVQLQIYDLLKTKWHLLIEGHEHQSIHDVIDHCTEALSLFALDKQGLRVDPPPQAQPMPDVFIADIKGDLDSLRNTFNLLQGSTRRKKGK